MMPMPDSDPGPILLLTRPEAAGQRFAVQVGLTLPTVFAPLLRIDLLAVMVATSGLAGIILTSENGALAAARLPGLPREAWCVGDRTAEAALAEGLLPQSAAGDANALIDLILSQPVAGPLLHVRGEHSRGEVAARLIAAGRDVRQVIAYRQVPLPLSAAALSALHSTASVILPLFSPRTVSILAQQGPFTAPLHLVAISPAVANSGMTLHPATVLTARRPEAACMADLVRQAIDVAIKWPRGP